MNSFITKFYSICKNYDWLCLCERTENNLICAKWMVEYGEKPKHSEKFMVDGSANFYI